MKKYCETCEIKECPKECFNEHEGSMIALGKLANSIEKKSGKKILVLDENGNEVKK
jgi:hypothetical protein